MAICAVNYTLPSRRYTALVAKLNLLKAVRMLDSFWLYDGPLSAYDLGNLLAATIIPGDLLMVTEVQPGSSWSAPRNSQAASWLTRHITQRLAA